MRDYKPLLRTLTALLISAGAAGTRGQTSPQSPDSQTPAGEGGDQIVQLNPFEVSSKGDHGYSTANSVGATLLNTPILDTPMSIVVENRQFIDDVGATEPTQAAAWISGVTVASDSPGVGQLTVRGQNITAGIRDGVYDPISLTGGGFYDTALEERIEIVKGPEGTLYGDTSPPGGLMNVVSKTPQPIAATSLSAFVGSDEFGGFVYRGVLDTTGADPSNKSLEYRLILVAQQGTNISGGPDNVFAVDPMVSYQLPGGGTVLFRYSYQNFDRTFQGSWIVDATNHFSTMISPYETQGSSDEKDDQEQHAVDIEFNQPFKTGPIDWNARLYLRYNHLIDERLFYNNASPFADFLNAAGQVIGNESTLSFSDPAIATITVPTMNRILNQVNMTAGNALVDFAGTFNLGPTKNTLLIYASDLDYAYNQREYTGTYPGIILWSNQPGLGPIHPQDPGAEWGPVTYAINAETLNDTRSAGAQENMSLLDNRIILVAAIRNDHQNETVYNYVGNQATNGQIREGNTHKLGAVLRPIAPLSLFYNYSQTFSPAGLGTTAAGQSYNLPNLQTAISEEGAKLGLFDNRLVVTASYFRTVIANEVINLTGINPAGAQVTVATPVGQAIIRGWEMDGTWEATGNLDFLFGAGNLTSKTQAGIAARNVPFGTNYRLLAKYSFHDGFLRGLYMGAGLQHNGPRAGDATDDFNLPAYTMVDAFIGYRWTPHWKVQVNVNNVFNNIFAQYGVIRYFIEPSTPHDGSMTITYNY